MTAAVRFLMFPLVVFSCLIGAIIAACGMIIIVFINVLRATLQVLSEMYNGR